MPSNARHNKLPAAKPIALDEAERRALERIANGRSEEVRLVERSTIVLMASNGASNRQIAKAVRVTPKTVLKWRRRYELRRQQKPEDSVRERLADDQRPGRPDRFDEFFWVDVLKVATAEPESYGLPITHWTLRELTAKILDLGLTDTIHHSTVGRFLARCDLRPHRVRYWMNRKEDPEFDERATDVKDCLVQATTEPPAGEITVSFDEKTSMQAKEQIAAQQPMRPGKPTRIEFEYKRHGTLVLFAMMLIHSGQILGLTRANRTNEITAAVLIGLFRKLLEAGYSRIHVVLDQLNTHWSTDLIESIAQLCNLPTPPTEDIRIGAQRRAWLAQVDKPIVFHFTPKHASWLNPIEIWFGVLVKKLLRRGSFRSKEDLDDRIRRFIAYYNDRLAHPYTFKRLKRAA